MKILFSIILFNLLNLIEIHSDFHALYISVIQIQHHENSPKATVNIKVFTDDFQSALRNEFSDYQPVLEEILCEEKSHHIKPYFDKHFNININKQKQELTFLNCQKEGEVYWLKFELEVPKKWETLKVEADFLMELFPTQSNILNVEYQGEKRFGRMTKGNSSCETSF